MKNETPWGTWDAITVEELAAVLRGLEVSWFIAGGYALEAFAGRSWREHDDIDFAVARDDHLAVQRYLAPAWELHCADPPGSLNLWPAGVPLHAGVHDIWVRRDRHDSWRFQLMLNESDGNEWAYRRDARIRRPLHEVTFERDGVRYLQPEIQLLFKSKGMRPKDVLDFENVAPLLTDSQRTWLLEALELTEPGHPWCERLRRR